MPVGGSESLENQIFVSYSSHDAQRVRALVDALEAEGLKVFWDQEIPYGEDWESYIGIRLEAAPIVIAVWSQDSVKSRYVRSEVNRVIKRNVLVPVTIDAVEPPFGFEHINSANLVQWLLDGGGVLPPRLKSSILRKIPNRSDAATTKATISPPDVPPRRSAVVDHPMASPAAPADHLPIGNPAPPFAPSPTVSNVRPASQPWLLHPFVYGYVIAGCLAGLAMAAFGLASFSSDEISASHMISVTLICLAIGAAASALSAWLCHIWPGYDAAGWKLLAAAYPTNAGFFILVWAINKNPGNEQKIYVVGIVLLAFAPIAGLLLQRRQKAAEVRS